MKEHESDVEEGEQLLRPGKQKQSRKPRMIGWFRARRRALRRTFRRPHRLVAAAVKYLLLPLVSLVLLVAFFAPSYTNPPPHYRALEQRCKASKFANGCANPHNEKVFISSILYDKGGKLSGGLWGQSLLDLIHLLGKENVFLSIYESGSGLDGRVSLAKFKERVPCKEAIVSDVGVSLAGFPNVTMPDGTTRTKRIAFLSELRNRALRPLDAFQEDQGVVKYDKVMFLNDVLFRPMEAAHLVVSTNRRSETDKQGNYLAACALDFGHPWAMYDNYALRDAGGYAQYVNIFPFFSGRGKGLSRADIFAQRDAVRVKTCWGGMYVVQAHYVQNLERSMPSPDFQSLQTHIIEPANPRNITVPVRFRYEPEPYYDACESCLFPADVASVAAREGAREQGVYVNPYVRTAYSVNILNWLPIARRVERFMSPLFTVFTWFMPDDWHPYREVQEGDKFAEEMWDGHEWKLEDRIGRSGMFCGVREMQTLRRSKRSHGRNWWDTKMPPGQKLEFKTMWGEILPDNWIRTYNKSSPEAKYDFFEFDRWNES